MTENQRITLAKLLRPLTVRQFLLMSVVSSIILQSILWSGSFKDVRSFFIGFVWFFLVFVTQALGHSYFGMLSYRRWTWHEAPIKKLLFTVFIIVVYTSIAYIVVAVLVALSFYPVSLQEAFGIGTQGIKIAILLSFIFSFIFSAISFYAEWQKTKLEAERLKTELAKHQYNTLKQQVNPHFLFNSLNVLADLVHEDSTLSEKYIHQLSRIYRYVLSSTKHAVVPLSEELDFIDAYAFLLGIRFENKLSIVNKLVPATEEYIVPVSIQTLIENAVKHNEITQENPLLITIGREGDYLSVSNPYRPKKSAQEASGTGLVNLRQQYRLITSKNIEIIQSPDLFEVRIPIVNQPTNAILP